MKLIVGLGNPGREYEKTRHNVGFMAVDNFLGDVSYKSKNESLFYLDNINNVIFLKPMSYMNDSGNPVKFFVDYYKIGKDDILIIYDDMDFDVGTFKVKASGSSGGHNGMKSIIGALGTDEIKRVRIGISRPKYDKINYVLGKFSSEEMSEIEKVLMKVNEVIKDFIVLDFDKLMNKYN